MVHLDERNLIFVDESGFNLALHRHRGRSLIGTRATTVVPTIRGGNVSLLLAVSPEHGVIHRKVSLGGTTGEVYAQFIREMISSELVRSLGSCVIVADNATIHKTQATGEVLSGAEVNHELMFLPPYSPQLNPVEQAFSKVKLHVRSYELEGRTQLLTCIDDAIDSITVEDSQGWYREVRRYYVHCASGRPLL